MLNIIYEEKYHDEKKEWKKKQDWKKSVCVDTRYVVYQMYSLVY